MSLHVKEDEFKTLPVYQHLRKDLPKITYVCLGAVIDKAPSSGDQDAQDSKILLLRQQFAKLDAHWEEVIDLRRSTILNLAATEHIP